MLILGLGGNEPRVILNKLSELLDGADGATIAVSYIQLSGWQLLAPLLRSIETETRILCTDQLGITDPSAIRTIQDAGITIHCYKASNVYHPKVFVAHKNEEKDRYMLGSANLSQSALVTSVEAVFVGEDTNDELFGWFSTMFDDKKRSVPFDEARIAKLELAFAARLKSRITFQRSVSENADQDDASVSAMDTVETAFSSLPKLLVTLNADKAANNVRTFRQMKKVLDGDVALEGKAFSELKLVGLALDGGYTPLGRSVQNSSYEEIAEKWMAWIKHASNEELNTVSPSGLLLQTRIAFDAFWRLPKEITTFFLDHCESPEKDIRPLLQTIELLANTGKSFPELTVEDVATLSAIVTATGQLPRQHQFLIRDYLGNKGTRGWREPDRRIILEAWKNA